MLAKRSSTSLGPCGYCGSTPWRHCAAIAALKFPVRALASAKSLPIWEGRSRSANCPLGHDQTATWLTMETARSPARPDMGIFSAAFQIFACPDSMRAATLDYAPPRNLHPAGENRDDFDHQAHTLRPSETRSWRRRSISRTIRYSRSNGSGRPPACSPAHAGCPGLATTTAPDAEGGGQVTNPMQRNPVRTGLESPGRHQR